MHPSHDRLDLLLKKLSRRRTSLERVHAVQILHAWHIRLDVVSYRREQSGLSELAWAKNNALLMHGGASAFIYIPKDSPSYQLLAFIHLRMNNLTRVPILKHHAILEEILETDKITSDGSSNLVCRQHWLARWILVVEKLAHALPP